MRLAKPNGVKLVIKTVPDSIKALNKGVTDKYKLFIVVSNINDAKEIVENYQGVKSINIGGTSPADDKTNITKTIAVTSKEKEVMRKLINNGVDIYIQMVPSNSKVSVEKLL
jgi:Phosphotransferase system, mannose/fructose/N-acetylgalactosamine-specific component IIB